MLKAAANRDVQYLNRALEQGADVNWKESEEIEDKTALVLAARNGHEEVVRLLVNAGADVNNSNSTQSVPLFSPDGDHSVYSGDRNVCDFTPLQMAAENGNFGCVDLLINAGADVNMSDRCGNTPLSLAAANDHDGCVFTLLMAGARVNGKMTVSPLAAAVRNGHINVARMLILAGADVNMLGECLNRPLYYAAIGGNPECVSALLRAGASVNEAAKCNIFVPLIDAAKRGHYECCRMLIQVGADVNEKNRVGETAFFGAAFGGHYRILNLLLREGADINTTDSHGKNAMIKAASRYDGPDIQMLRFLLSAGANINLVGCPGNALTQCLRAKDERREAALLLFAAGETIDESPLKEVPEYLQPRKEINLMDICRRNIREHLLELDPHENLFVRVSKLGLEVTVSDFLVYNQTIEDTHDDAEQ